MSTTTVERPAKHCIGCGRVIVTDRIRKHNESQKYCTFACFIDTLRKPAKACRTCPTCGDEFTPKPKAAGRFCSPRCGGGHRGPGRPMEGDHLTASMTSEQLDALIASQRPTMLLESDQKLTPKRGWQYVRPDKEDMQAEGRGYWAGLNEDAAWRLHEATEPDAIGRDQRNAIREALTELGAGATVERVSEACIISEWVVTRRLEEMGRTVPA